MKNIFAGNGDNAKFARAIYKRIVTGKWFTNADVMADFLGLESAKELQYSVSSDPSLYNKLKKSFDGVKKELKKELGDCCIEKTGNNRDQKIRYVGKKRNPLAYLLATAAKDSLEVYYQFCQDSTGFIPQSWLDYFLSETVDLLDLGRKNMQEQQIMESSIDCNLRNIEQLPYIYECIRDKKTLRVEYSAGYTEKRTIIFHPHFLKEFNGRWQIYGYTPDNRDEEPSQGFIVPIDRIISFTEVDVPYQEPEGIDYSTFFNDFVGFSYKDTALQEIVIRIHALYMFNIVDTKPLHRSHRVITPFNSEQGYGDISYIVRPNTEFYGKVLQMGSDLEIISPKEVRDEIAKRITDMNSRYK